MYRIMDEYTNKPDSERFAVIEEAAELLCSENIFRAIKTYKPDKKEKEIAAEFVKSYVQFINEIVSHDLEAVINRSDFEIKDLVAHVNSMMRKKDEYIFNSMVAHSPSHYRSIQKIILKKETDEPGEANQ